MCSPAVEDALAGGVELLVCITEGVPVHDTLKLVRMVRERGAVLIGPSTPGIAVPGRMKIGFLPDAALTPGPLGVMSKSGTLSYEVCYRLAQRGVGQSLWIGSGGDPVKGARFADLVPLFQSHAETQAVLVIGEIGGTEEEELAEALDPRAFLEAGVRAARRHHRARRRDHGTRRRADPRHARHRRLEDRRARQGRRAGPCHDA